MENRPELLLHPTIPPPLHGIAPREVLGNKWWNETRKIAYDKFDDHCHACGTHKSKAKYHRTKKQGEYKSLEAHEAYDIDYDNHTVKLSEVVALCHNYIHVGRLLAKYNKNVVSRRYVTNVLNHGVQVLTGAGYEPQATQAIHWLMLEKGYSKYDAIEYVIKQKLPREKFNPHSWDMWKMVIDGKEYHGKDYIEWSKVYE